MRSTVTGRTMRNYCSSRRCFKRPLASRYGTMRSLGHTGLTMLLFTVHDVLDAVV